MLEDRDVVSYRLSALQLALGFAAQQGVTCERCITETAHAFWTFLRTGEASGEHPATEDEDESPLFTFTPDDEKPN